MFYVFNNYGISDVKLRKISAFLHFVILRKSEKYDE